MRIIGGELGGRHVPVPKGLPVRPTTERAREALFNWLENRVNFSDKRILDLYAGTGGVGLEFLSRGAGFLTSVDINSKVISHLQQLKEDLALEHWEIIKSPALKALSHLKEYDLVFADPPYADKRIPELVQAVLEFPDQEKGFFILEHFSKLHFTSKRLIERRVYGQSTFSIYSI
jgi:16S rRNA (guanine966-N2)-methyltransferase